MSKGPRFSAAGLKAGANSPTANDRRLIASWHQALRHRRVILKTAKSLIQALCEIIEQSSEENPWQQPPYDCSILSPDTPEQSSRVYGCCHANDNFHVTTGHRELLLLLQIRYEAMKRDTPWMVRAAQRTYWNDLAAVREDYAWVWGCEPAESWDQVLTACKKTRARARFSRSHWLPGGSDSACGGLYENKKKKYTADPHVDKGKYRAGERAGKLRLEDFHERVPNLYRAADVQTVLACRKQAKVSEQVALLAAAERRREILRRELVMRKAKEQK